MDEATSLKATPLPYQEALDQLQAGLDEALHQLASALAAIPVKDSCKIHGQCSGT